MWKLFTYGKIFTHGKIKSGRKLTKKKQKQKKNRKKKGSKKRERVPFCQEKKKSFMKPLVLAEFYAGVQISSKEVAVKPKFFKHNAKNEVSFHLCKY